MQKQFGLIGRKLGHSFSKDFFTRKFSDEGINAEYLNFEIPYAELILEIIEIHPRLQGLNVTIPYKEEIIKFLDRVDPAAKAIGAVNTIKIERKEGRPVLTGYNTDIIGFSESIKPFLKGHEKKALVLGTGGAAKAIYAALDKLNIKPTFVSRKSGEGILTYNDLNPEIMADYYVIVNTTPLGMWPDIDSAPVIPYECIGDNHIAFDAVYNPDPTLFLRKCAESGATIVSGIKMLHGQALASWEIWNDTTSENRL